MTTEWLNIMCTYYTYWCVHVRASVRVRVYIDIQPSMFCVQQILSCVHAWKTVWYHSEIALPLTLDTNIKLYFTSGTIILKHFLIWASYRGKKTLIDFAKTAKVHTFCLANSLLDSPMATWLTNHNGNPDCVFGCRYVTHTRSTCTYPQGCRLQCWWAARGSAVAADFRLCLTYTEPIRYDTTSSAFDFSRQGLPQRMFHLHLVLS